MGRLHVKFHEDRCKGEAFIRLKPFYLTARLQTDGRTDRRTDRQTDGRTGWFQYTPPNFVAGGITSTRPIVLSMITGSYFRRRRRLTTSLLFSSPTRRNSHCIWPSLVCRLDTVEDRLRDSFRNKFLKRYFTFGYKAQSMTWRTF